MMIDALCRIILLNSFLVSDKLFVEIEELFSLEAKINF